MRLRYARLRTHQQGRPAAGWCRRPIDKATRSTPSARRRRPDLRTPPRCDRPQGDPRSLPAQARRVQAGRRACDRPGAVSSRTPAPRGGGAGARPGPGWPAFRDIGAARLPGLVGGGCLRVLARVLAGAWLAPLRCAASCLLACPPGGGIVQPGGVAMWLTRPAAGKVCRTRTGETRVSRRKSWTGMSHPAHTVLTAPLERSARADRGHLRQAGCLTTEEILSRPGLTPPR